MQFRTQYIHKLRGVLRPTGDAADSEEMAVACLFYAATILCATNKRPFVQEIIERATNSALASIMECIDGSNN